MCDTNTLTRFRRRDEPPTFRTVAPGPGQAAETRGSVLAGLREAVVNLQLTAVPLVAWETHSPPSRRFNQISVGRQKEKQFPLNAKREFCFILTSATEVMFSTVCLSICLFAAWLQKLQTTFNDIFRWGQQRAMNQSLTCCIQARRYGNAALLEHPPN